MAVKHYIWTLLFFLFTGCAHYEGYYSYQFPEPFSYPSPSTVYIIERYPPFWWYDPFFGIYFVVPLYPEPNLQRRKTR